MKLRLANMIELHKLMHIIRQASRYMEEQGIFQWDEVYPDEETIREDIAREELYVLYEEEELLALVTLNEVQDESYSEANWLGEQEHIAVIHRLCVNTIHQHKGIGKAVLQVAEELLKEKGYKGIRLDAYTQNPYAIKLYENAGYHKVHEVTFRKGQFYLYEKTL